MRQCDEPRRCTNPIPNQPKNHRDAIVTRVVQDVLLANPGIIPLAYDPYSALFLATPHTFALAWSEWLGPQVFERFQASV